VARKKNDGIGSLIAPPEPVSIQEINMLDWFAAFCAIGQQGTPEERAKIAFATATAMMRERERLLNPEE
jgi:hypothetical protein